MRNRIIIKRHSCTCLPIIKWNQLKSIKKRHEQTENKQTTLNLCVCRGFICENYTIFVIYVHFIQLTNVARLFFRFFSMTFWFVWQTFTVFQLLFVSYPLDHNSIWINLNCLTTFCSFTHIDLHNRCHYAYNFIFKHIFFHQHFSVPIQWVAWP